MRLVSSELLLLTGNINIPLKILDDFGPHFPAGAATVKSCAAMLAAWATNLMYWPVSHWSAVLTSLMLLAHQVAEAKGCRDLRDMPGSKVELSGTLVYHKITYLVRCCNTASPPVLLSVSARAASRVSPSPDLLSARQSTPAPPSR